MNEGFLIFESLLYFLSWTLLLYWVHRIAHSMKFLKKFHLDHHRFISRNGNSKSKWNINNLFLYNDSTYSTIDLWITEVIPTFLFALATGHWWIFLFYYIWAACFQEFLEHKKGINLPFFTFGDWHLIHHRNFNSNYGLFFPLWDIVFRTNIKHKEFA